MTDVRVLERVLRTSALGIRFVDVATGIALIDGLRVEIFSRANPTARAPMQVNRSGVYVAHAAPGLRSFELSAAAPDALWATAVRSYRVEVSDPFGRFLPIAFDADVPFRGLFTELGPLMSPPLALGGLLEGGSPAQPLFASVPLFSTPSRPLPEPLGVVYAQLRELGTPRPAAWNLLRVDVEGRPCGIGLADAEGRVAVMFAYPDPPHRHLTSPPESHNDFSWSVELAAFGQAVMSPPPAPVAIPDLADILAQLQRPRTVVASTLSPGAPLRLEYRVPLTARTAGLAGADASYLFVTG